MPSSVRPWLSRVAGLVLAVGLLWLALRGVDAGSLGAIFARADLRWAVPLVAVALLSHLVRAWRWRLLLSALPDVQDATGRPARARVPSLGETYAAVLMGYAVNYALPRAGEVVRTATVARRTGLDASSVLGTVVLDRLLDMATLALGLATLPFVLRDRLAPATAMFVHPVRDRLAASPGLAWALGVGALAGVLVAARLWRRRGAGASSGPSAGPPSRVRTLVAGFRDGLATLARSRHRGALVGATAVMWALYLGMAYLPFVMLRQAAPYGLSLADGWAIMLLGSLGMVVPAPGGAGSFHYVTIETLTRLWAVARPDAAAYAVLAHGAQLVVYAVAGAIGFAALSLRPGRPGPREADPARDEPNGA